MSFLDDLRTVRDQVERNDTITIAVPPANRMAVRFRSPEDRDALTPYVAAYRTGGALTGEQECQLIIDCCDEILRITPTGNESYADDDHGPLTFNAGDDRWGDGDDAPKSARECVRRLYNTDKAPLATSGTADTLMGWLQGLRDEAVEAVEGKSGGSETS